MSRHTQPAKSRGWKVALVAALAIAVVDGAERLFMLRSITALDALGNAHPARASDSFTGYVLEQRDVVLPGSGLDGYHWIMQSQQMLAQGAARVRHVDYDNVPHGREVHWSFPLRWWLVAVGGVHHLITGEPMPISLERTGPIANMLLLLGLLLALVPITTRRFGPLSAALLAVGMVAAYPFFEAFTVGAPDHHSIALAAGLMLLLFLIVGGCGWVRAGAANSAKGRSSPADAMTSWPVEYSAARRWFAAAAISGAMGVWVSAATLLPVIAATAFGAGLAAVLLRRNATASNAMPEPRLWQWWGMVGGVACLAFYLLEYFPDVGAVRLEVNHPLYALAWMGGGTIVSRIWLWSSGRSIASTKRDVIVIVAAVFAVVAPAAVIVIGQERVFAVLDPMVSAVPIGEFLGFGEKWRNLPWLESIVGISLLPLLAIPLLVMIARRDLPVPLRCALLVLLSAGGCTLVLGWVQIRWLGISCSVWLVALVLWGYIMATGAAWTGAPRWRAGAIIVIALIMLPYPAYVLKFGVDVLTGNAGVSVRDMQQVAARDLARWLRARTGSEPATVLTGPDLTTVLMFHGGHRGVGTLYWENREGLGDAVRIFGAKTADEARAMIRKRGITHVILSSWDSFPIRAPRSLRGDVAKAGAGAEFFVDSLGDVLRAPRWLRPVHFQLPDHTYLKDDFVRVYEVVDDPGVAQAAVDRAWYLLSDDQAAPARELLRRLLTAEPGNTSALIALAHVQLQSGEDAAFRRTLTQLARSPSPVERLDDRDRIALAVAWALLDEHARAAREIGQVLGAVDERGLRNLSVRSLADLVMLARQYNLSSRDPRLLELAAELIPPVIRDRLGLSLPATP